jgi:hypothetical protein
MEMFTMTYQTNSNIQVAYMVQSGLGTPAAGAGGTVLRQAGGQGLRLTKATTASKEVRRDGMMSRGRHGSQRTTVSYDHELTKEGLLDILEAVMRDTWESSDLVIDEGDFTSITTTASTIVLASGDPRSLGLRVGDVIRLSNHSTTANNDRNLRITGLSATTITVAETLTLDATPDTACSITRPRKLIQYSASSLVKRYFTVEEVDLDLDKSELASDVVWGSVKIAMQTDGTIVATVAGAGTGQFTVNEDSACPVLTSPTEGTSLGLAVVDATLRVNGVDMVELESFDVTLDIQPTAPATFGSGDQKYAPDVFTGNMQVSINLTMLRKDLEAIKDQLAETRWDLHVLMVENEAEPKDFLSMYIGNFTIGDVQKSAAANQGGGRTVTIQIPAALVGKDTRGTGYDATMVRFQTSVAAS